jgi:RES domain-containing protein
VKEIKKNKLKTDWVTDFEYTRFMGDQFIKAGTHAILKVPSAEIKEEHNFIMNPLHIDFKKIKITQTVSFSTDKRLFSI